MGILDDLKSQSEVQRAREEQEKQRQVDLLKYYQGNLHPKMLQLYTFLNELIEHLNYIKTDIKVLYPMSPDGSMQEFQQADYKVTIDSANEVKEINLRFYCSLKAPLVFEVENSERIQRYTDVLHSYRIGFDRTDNKNSNYELISAKFKVVGPIPVNVILQGDVATSSIHLILNNFEKAGASKHTFKERHITEEFIDNFGKYILRQNPEFLKLEIADEHKEIIRQNIQADLKQRQQELEEADKLFELEKAQQAEKKSWKNVFKKTD
ncbi:MAG: hypothetical protein OQK75_12320 [Gammaproteobacteria bacterium]|nr:hypothetical protein [Gammaproteobacteria bacterium]